MADADENRILKDSNNNNDLKVNSIVEEEIEEGGASKTQVGNEDDLKSTCTDEEEEEEEEDVKEMNYDDKEAIEDLISKLHINGDQLPTNTIGKNVSSPLNNLRCRGRSTLLLFYRLWRDHLVKKPPL
uniref:Uncharacterized protein n=1 Tax=Solanum tuberosum TaxID=4113 RepID=M1DBT0_SOLTU